ncbi:MAG TPA: hypothetical protein VFJ98_08830 [Mycobacteriales bacterium]|nr:hypothetical protein [Mycobacteriales bacterium]
MVHALVRRSAIVSAAAAAGVGLLAAPALAHECFVASRSAQGDAAVAAHSGAWEQVSLDTVLTQFLGLPAGLATCVEANAAQFGIPDSFVFGNKQAQGQGGVIAENNPNMVAGDLGDNGTGIDHGEDAYGPAIGAAIGYCSGS